MYSIEENSTCCSLRSDLTKIAAGALSTDEDLALSYPEFISMFRHVLKGRIAVIQCVRIAFFPANPILGADDNAPMLFHKYSSQALFSQFFDSPLQLLGNVPFALSRRKRWVVQNGGTNNEHMSIAVGVYRIEHQRSAGLVVVHLTYVCKTGIEGS